MTREYLEEQLALAREQNQKGKYASAEEVARKILSATEFSNEMQDVYCDALIVVSSSLWRRSKLKDALPFGEEAVLLAEVLHNKELEGKALHNIGLVWSFTSDYDRALEYFHKSYDRYEEINHNHGMASNSGNIGTMFMYQSDYPRALEYYKKSLVQYKEIGVKDGVGRMYGNIANIYLHTSDYPRALKNYQDSYAIYEELGDKIGMANFFSNCGNVYSGTSDYQRALENYVKALTIYEEFDNKVDVANIYTNIGNVYSALLDYRHALEYHQKASLIYEKIGNKAGEGVSLGCIGAAYSNLKDYLQAVEYSQKSLEIDEQIGNKAGAAKTLDNIGIAYQKLSHYLLALEYHQRALLINEKIGNKADLAYNLGNIGIIYAVEQFEGYNAVKAEEFMLKSVQIFSDLGSKNGERELHYPLSELYEKQGRWEESLEHYKKYHELEKEVQSEEAKKSFERFELQMLQKEHEIERLAHELVLEKVQYEKDMAIIAKEQAEKERENAHNELKLLATKIIRTNEILRGFIHSLEGIKVEGKSKEELRDVIRSVNDTLTNEQHWEIFRLQFNIVHGKFIELLSEKHPNLSSQEKRICAFLQSDMSSKDIALLMNNSIRTIETHRNMIRKKMELNHDDNLTIVLKTISSLS